MEGTGPRDFVCGSGGRDGCSDRTRTRRSSVPRAGSRRCLAFPSPRLRSRRDDTRAAARLAGHEPHGAVGENHRGGGRGRLPGGPRCGPARRHDHAASGGDLHGELHPAEQERDGLDRRPHIRPRRQPAAPGHTHHPGLRDRAPQGGQPDLGPGDRGRGRRPSLPADRARGHDRARRHQPHRRRRPRPARRVADADHPRPGAARHHPGSPVRPRARHHSPSPLYRPEQRRHGHHRLLRLGRAPPGLRCPGDRQLERARPLQDRQQPPRGVGREPDVRRRRPGDPEPGALRHRDPPQPLLQAAGLAGGRAELWRHPLGGQEPARVQERATRPRRRQRARAQLVRRPGRLRGHLHAAQPGRAVPVVGRAGRDLHQQCPAPQRIGGQFPRHRQQPSEPADAAHPDREQPVRGHRRRQVGRHRSALPAVRRHRRCRHRPQHGIADGRDHRRYHVCDGAGGPAHGLRLPEQHRAAQPVRCGRPRDQGRPAAHAHHLLPGRHLREERPRRWRPRGLPGR